MSVSGKESKTSIRFYSCNIAEGKKRKMCYTLTNQMTGFANEETLIKEESMTINVQRLLPFRMCHKLQPSIVSKMCEFQQLYR